MHKFLITALSLPLLLSQFGVAPRAIGAAPVAAVAAPASQVKLPQGFEIQTVTANLDQPVEFLFVPDGRIFIAEKAGRVKVFKDGVVFTQPLIDLRDEVNEFVDHGLLGMVLDPDFTTNGYIYLLYAWDAPGQTKDVDEPRRSRLMRYTVEGNIIRPNTGVLLLDDHWNDTQNHSVGTLAFDKDGALWVSLGDGSLSAMPDKLSLRAQRLDNVQGKVLRIDRHTGNGLPGNPFYDEKNPKSAQSRIWSYGYRNPFRFALSPATGLPYVGDVGWNTYEFLMIAAPGSNFGWPCMEGSTILPPFQAAPECKDLTYDKTTKKELIYPHNNNNASVTAGDFVTGTNWPAEWQGDFIYGDYSTQAIKRVELNATGAFSNVLDFASNAGEVVAFKFGPDGALYYLSIYSGGFRRIVRTGAPLGSLATMTATQPISKPVAAITAPSDGDVYLPGQTVQLSGEAKNATNPRWHITRYDGRRSSLITDTVGATASFVMPQDMADNSTIEAIFTAESKGSIVASKVNVYAPNSDGYIRSWWLMGGWPYGTLANDELPGGEANHIPMASDPLAWAVRSPTRNVNFLKYFTPNYKSVAYAFVWIDSPSDRKGLLGMNSDDGIATWLNGKEIWRNKVSRFMPDDTRDIDLPAIELKKGLNPLLIKVDTNDGDWQFKARILNPDGSIMRDVTMKMK